MAYHLAQHPPYDFGAATTTFTDANPVDLQIIDLAKVAGKIPILVVTSITLNGMNNGFNVALQGSFDKVTWYAYKELGADSAVTMPSGITSLNSNHRVIWPLDDTTNFESIVVPSVYPYVKYVVTSAGTTHDGVIVTRTIVV
jgi:hypothetical protein